jgi:ankyrin repeat protein
MSFIYPDDVFMAASDGNLEAFQRLVDEGADFLSETDDNHNSVLHCAAASGHVEFCRYLLEQGIDVGWRSKCGETALHLAAAWEGDELCRVLVGAGQSPSDPGPAKWAWWEKPSEGGYLTPFQSAVRFGNEGAANYFVLECGEDPAQRTADGKTMRMLAKGDKGMLALLRSLETELSTKAAMAFVERVTGDPGGDTCTAARRSGLSLL